MHINQVAEPPQRGKASTKFVMLCCAWEAKLGDKMESSSRKLIRSHKVEFNKPFKNQIKCDDEREDTTKTTRPTKHSNLFSTFLSPLALQQCQLHPHRRGIVGHAPDRVTARVAHQGEARQVPEIGGGKFRQYPEGGTASVDLQGDPTKSGYLNFDLGGMSTINWSPTGAQVSEYSISHDGKPSSHNRQDPTG